jgi:quercetin dioxygenase-like cupin family protein
MDDTYAMASALDVDAAQDVVRWSELLPRREWQELRFEAIVVPPGGISRRHQYTRQETLYVPLDGPGQVGLGEERVTVPETGVLRVPPSEPRRIVNTADENRTLLAVGAPPESGPDAVHVDVDEAPDPEYAVVDVADASFEKPSEGNSVPSLRLTAPLGCENLKANVRRLEPGGEIPPHTHGTQEEAFVPLGGPGAMRVGEETVDVPAGAVLSAPPETPRGAVNRGDEPRSWLMVGAPPTGGPEEWGEYTILDE